MTGCLSRTRLRVPVQVGDSSRFFLVSNIQRAAQKAWSILLLRIAQSRAHNCVGKVMLQCSVGLLLCMLTHASSLLLSPIIGIRAARAMPQLAVANSIAHGLLPSPTTSSRSRRLCTLAHGAPALPSNAAISCCGISSPVSSPSLTRRVEPAELRMTETPPTDDDADDSTPATSEMTPLDYLTFTGYIGGFIAIFYLIAFVVAPESLSK